MSKQCPNCYTLNEDSSQFCNKCGFNLTSNNNSQQNFNQQQIYTGPIKQKSNDNFCLMVVLIIIIILMIPLVALFTY